MYWVKGNKGEWNIILNLDLSEQVILSALLHDIGKFWQRTSYSKSNYQPPLDIKLNPDEIGLSGAHAKWSAEFIAKYFPNTKDVELAVLYHHNPEKAPTKNAHKIALVVQIADWLSSAERKERIDEKSSPKDEPLISIFSKIKNIKEGINEQITDQEYYYKLTNLDFLKENLIPLMTKKKIMSGYNLIPDYDLLWNAFIKEFEGLGVKNLTIEILLQLFEKYAWAIPQATYLHQPDISLYDHLKTTCALAGNLFKLNLSENDLLSLRENLRDNKEKIFTLLKGDISGIQNFIFTITSKNALKTLKARSLFLEFLTESIARSILVQLGLPICNLLYCGGGNFYLILPSKIEDQLIEIRSKIIKTIQVCLGEQIYVALDWISLTTSDMMRENFNNKWDEVSSKVNEKKLSAYSEIGKDEFYKNFFLPFEEGGTKTQCAICKVELTEENKKQWGEGEEELTVCNLCDSFAKMIGEIKTATKVYISEFNKTKALQSSIKDYQEILERIGIGISLSESKKVKQTNYIIPVKGLPIIPFKVISKGLPLNEIFGTIKDLDTIVKTARGAEKLAVLKMDVDNLGKIFKEGLGEDNTISRISTLSNMLSRFFNGYIDFLIENNRYYSEGCYLIFSGGDDLSIIGAWDKILDFATEINNEFRKYTCYNPHLTLSAGIAIIDQKFPIIRAMEQAEEALSEAKINHESKNCINLFGDSFQWDVLDKKPIKVFIEQVSQGIINSFNEYEIIWYIKELLVEMVEGGCSKSIFEKINSSTKGLEMVLKQTASGKMEIPRIWRLRYYLRDYLKKNSKWEIYVNCIIAIYETIAKQNFFTTQTNKKFMKITSILAAVKWAEMLTRKKE